MDLFEIFIHRSCYLIVFNERFLLAELGARGNRVPAPSLSSGLCARCAFISVWRLRTGLGVFLSYLYPVYHATGVCYRTSAPIGARDL